MTKKCNWKRTRNSLLLFLLFWSLIIKLDWFEYIIFQCFHSVVVCQQTAMIIEGFQFAFGSVSWMARSGKEIVHLGEPVLTHVIQTFIYSGLYFFAEPSERAVRFLVRFGNKPFLSYNRPQLWKEVVTS